MDEVLYHVSTKILYGPESVKRLGLECSPLGSRALLICDPDIQENNFIPTIREKLTNKNIQSILIDGLTIESSIQDIEKTISMARISKCQFVIGVGGITVLSIARAIAASVNTEKGYVSLLSGIKSNQKPLPFVEIPTTFRDPFAFNNQVLLQEHSSNNPLIVPVQPHLTRAVFFDPNFSESLTQKQFITILMDTVLLCVEGYLSLRSNFLTDMYFLESIRHLSEASMNAIRNDFSSLFRESLTKAGLITSLGLSISSQGVGTALSLVIGFKNQLPKTWIASIILPHILDYFVRSRSKKLANIAEAMGEDIQGIGYGEAAFRTSAVIRRLLGQLKIPTRLRDLDISKDKLLEYADIASQLHFISYSPVPISSDELYDILKLSY